MDKKKRSSPLSGKKKPRVARSYDSLKATPIMLYPTPEQRERIVAAAEADERSVSNFILNVVGKHLDREEVLNG
jgi:uncharacterized protein (DUF1778 family)